MNARNEIKMLLAKRGLTLTYLAKYLTEHSSRKYSLDLLSKKLKSNMIRYSEMQIIAEALNMELIFRDKN